jgi:hypothetical protein
MNTGYSSVGPSVALVAATAKTVIGVNGTSAFGVDLLDWWIGFDGVTAGNVPVLVELCYSTFATNAPGTASTTITPVQTRGRAITPGFTSAYNWTTEPTVLTVLKRFLLTPNGGLIAYGDPLGNTYDSAVSNGFVIRCTAPAAVNVIASLDYSRC